MFRVHTECHDLQELVEDACSNHKQHHWECPTETRGRQEHLGCLSHLHGEDVPQQNACTVACGTEVQVSPLEHAFFLEYIIKKFLDDLRKSPAFSGSVERIGVKTEALGEAFFVTCASI